MNDHEDDVLTVQEVSAYLRLAESTIYKLAQEGHLPGRKIGGRWRFSKQRLEQWLQDRPVGLANSSLEDDAIQKS